MDKEIFLSVVIPAYNEEENLKKGVLEKVSSYLEKQNYPFEVIVVDDGSEDKTTEIAQDFCQKHSGFSLIKNPHQGKAGTVKTGVLTASGRYILFTDMDQATPLSEVERLLPYLEKEGFDIAIGSRQILGAERKGEPWYRHFIGRGFNFLVHLVAISEIQDTQCGFKCFKKEVARDLFSRLRVDGGKKIKGSFTGAFDVELLYLAQKRGYKIVEIPIDWNYVKTTRVDPVKDSVRMFIQLLTIKINDLRGAYD